MDSFKFLNVSKVEYWANKAYFVYFSSNLTSLCELLWKLIKFGSSIATKKFTRGKIWKKIEIHSKLFLSKYNQYWITLQGTLYI